MKPRIIYIGAPEADATDFAARIRAEFPGVDIWASNDRAAALAKIDDAEVLIAHHFQFDDGLLERAKQLRWIQSLTTGTDAIVNLAALRPDVILTSTRGMHGPQMSELIFLQMLCLLRDVPRLLRNQAAARWERWPQPLLWGKTVVSVGVGAIAESLAPRCKAFGMNVFGVSHSPRLPPGFDGVFDRAHLHQAAAQADFLVLLVPLTGQTENLVDAGVLAAMKPGAFVINVARGGVLDEDALLQVLRAKRLAGAALDVFREHPLPEHSPLWHTEGILVTPLIGGMSDIYLDQAYGIIRDNLRQYLAGQPQAMRNIVPH